MDTDPREISLREEYEVRYWTELFGVSKDELREAIDAVGRSADQVRHYLASHRRADRG